MLTHDDLATFRLNARPDVIYTWQVEATTYAFGYYCQVKIAISGCGFTPAISKSKKTHLALQSKESSFVINQTRILLSPDATKLDRRSFHHLKKENLQPTGAAKAYRKSQTGTGEGTDNLDFMADVKALEVIDPDAVQKEA